MTARSTPIGAGTDTRSRKRSAPKDPRPRSRDLLIEHLHDLQDRFGHLGATHLEQLAREMGLDPAEIREVASFYRHFDMVDEGGAVPPRLTVRVCDSLVCEMAGAQPLLRRLSALQGSELRVVAVPCIGRCEQAPAVMVGQHAVAEATPEAVCRAVETGCHRPQTTGCIDFEAYRDEGGYALLKTCIAGELDVEDVIAALEQAGLRGLGGAGFPTARKWSLVRNEPAPRLMVVNLHDAEPGSFKDRVLLERDPHRLLEGMLIAAWSVGIARIYIYLRDEYHACRRMLEAELDKLRARPPWAGMPEIVLRRGAGAYLGGEVSALIESIEGKCALPRGCPPPITQRGLFGRPTLQHHFETLYWVREILEKGSAWFVSHGRHGYQGLRGFSVSGRVREPGVKLAPTGITVRELIAEYCGGMAEGHTFYAYLPGGASGGILPASMGDIPLDFDTLQPHGCSLGSAAVVVLSDQDSAAGAARNLRNFFERESGGRGQRASNPVDCALKYFPGESR
jgi:NADH:ubiquinone oxidoreductase subunit F (NADH-binding)/NADH:ubiquinone oxidoreductase subunit E